MHEHHLRSRHQQGDFCAESASLLRDYKVLDFQGSSRHFGLSAVLRRLDMSEQASCQTAGSIRVGGRSYAVRPATSHLTQLLCACQFPVLPTQPSHLASYIVDCKTALSRLPTFTGMGGAYLAGNVCRKFAERAAFHSGVDLGNDQHRREFLTPEAVQCCWADVSGHWQKQAESWRDPMFSCLFKRAFAQHARADVAEWLHSDQAVESFKAAALSETTVLEATRVAIAGFKRGCR